MKKIFVSILCMLFLLGCSSKQESITDDYSQSELLSIGQNSYKEFMNMYSLFTTGNYFQKGSESIEKDGFTYSVIKDDRISSLEDVDKEYHKYFSNRYDNLYGDSTYIEVDGSFYEKNLKDTMDSSRYVDNIQYTSNDEVLYAIYSKKEDGTSYDTGNRYSLIYENGKFVYGGYFKEKNDESKQVEEKVEETSYTAGIYTVNQDMLIKAEMYEDAVDVGMVYANYYRVYIKDVKQDETGSYWGVVDNGYILIAEGDVEYLTFDGKMEDSQMNYNSLEEFATACSVEDPYSFENILEDTSQYTMLCSGEWILH